MKTLAAAILILLIFATTASAVTCTYRCSGRVCWVECN